MKRVHVCVPVLRRYDLLKRLLASLDKSTLPPAEVYIIDNGANASALVDATFDYRGGLSTYEPGRNLGVAKSWNWFIDNVPEERVILNDDLELGPAALSTLASQDGDIVFAKDQGFSCFLLRDSCVEKIGVFDESISPGYGYYEDDDYLQRIDGKGTRTPSVVTCDVAVDLAHERSSTLKAKFAAGEEGDHHRRFHIARANYMAKWRIASL